jgi:hypothetical protein
LSRSQRLVVDKLLADSVTWQLALPSDNTNPNLKDQRRDQPGYQPYYLEADIDHDGQEDFVVALIHKPDTSFAVFLFRRLNELYASPQLIFSSRALQRCGLFFIRDHLVVGEFYTDNAVTFRWDSTLHKLVEIAQVPDDE